MEDLSPLLSGFQINNFFFSQAQVKIQLHEAFLKFSCTDPAESAYTATGEHRPHSALEESCLFTNVSTSL